MMVILYTSDSAVESSLQRIYQNREQDGNFIIEKQWNVSLKIAVIKKIIIMDDHMGKGPAIRVYRKCINTQSGYEQINISLLWAHVYKHHMKS